MEGKAHCALLTVTHFWKAVVRRFLIQLTSLISSCSTKYRKVMKRLQAHQLCLHIKTCASAQYRAGDRYRKCTCDRWKKHLLIGKEQLSSQSCHAHVCAIRKKINPENSHCIKKRCTPGPGFTSAALRQATGVMHRPSSPRQQWWARRQTAMPQMTMTRPLKEPILPNAPSSKDGMHFITVQDPVLHFFN